LVIDDEGRRLLGAMVRFLRESHAEPPGPLPAKTERRFALSRRSVFEHLTHAIVGVPVGLDGDARSALGRNMGGEPVVVAFTDAEAARSWLSRECVAAPAGWEVGPVSGLPALISFTVDTGAAMLWLNPAGPAGIGFSAADLNDQRKNGSLLHRRRDPPDDPLMDEAQRAAARRRWSAAMTEGRALLEQDNWEPARTLLSQAQREATAMGDTVGLTEAFDAVCTTLAALQGDALGAEATLRVAVGWSKLGATTAMCRALARAGRMALDAIEAGDGDPARLGKLLDLVEEPLARLAIPGTEPTLLEIQAAGR
jgi:hypothetical protein